MATAIAGRLHQGWQVVVRQRFWVLVGLAIVAGVVGDAWLRGWWSAAIPFLVLWWPWILIGMATTAIVSRLSWWLWWRLPQREVDRRSSSITDPKSRADVEDNFRKTITQLFAWFATAFAGGIALIAAVIAYLQLSQQQRAAHDLLISNQVAKGFELLGNKEKDVSLRLGGIYALEGVMNASDQYYQPVLETLCAFVRDETRTKAGDDTPVTEIQAALTVIGRRKPGLGTVDLSGAHIVRASLDDADLSHAILHDTDLSRARLFGADLSHARLSGDPDRG